MMESIYKKNIILYADDDKDDQQLVQEAFERYASNVKIILADNGVEALDYLNSLLPIEPAPCLGPPSRCRLRSSKFPFEMAVDYDPAGVLHRQFSTKNNKPRRKPRCRSTLVFAKRGTSKPSGSCTSLCRQGGRHDRSFQSEPPSQRAQAAGGT